MSEFKFACPVCGQHITCDSGSSGTQMNCPTCFRKLVVPQALGPQSQNFVLTASEVSSRPVPLPGDHRAGGAPPPHSNKSPAILILTLGLLLGVVGAGVWMFRDRLIPAKPKPSEISPGAASNHLATVKLLPPSTNWTLKLADAKIPNAPASGMIRGRSFALERAVIHGGRLDLRQGPKWPPDVGLSIHLFADRSEDLAGKTVVLDATRTNAPRVILRWKDEGENPVTKDFRQGYAARVEFGGVTNNRLTGKIFLAAPDDAKSYVAGTFSAEIRKPNPPKK